MKRIEAIESLFCGKILADIGSDHGFIAQRAVARGFSEVIVTDISQMCLAKAKNLLAECENVSFFCGDGLEPIKNQLKRVDCIAICGMGGNTICDILGGFSGEDFGVNTRIILAPQNDVHRVRAVLSAKFDITDDLIVWQRGKFYDIIACSCGEKSGESLTDLQLYFGKFYQQRNENLAKKLEYLEKKYSAYTLSEKNLRLLEAIREAKKYQN